jgi:hypothetical protein
MFVCKIYGVYTLRLFQYNGYIKGQNAMSHCPMAMFG